MTRPKRSKKPAFSASSPRSPDDVRQRGAGGGVKQREPKHIARNLHRAAADGNGQHAGQFPKHDGKRRDGGNLFQQPEQKLERQADEEVDILLDTLVGVVHAAVADDLEAIMSLVFQPRRQIAARHPCAPSDFQQLPQVDGIDGDADIDEREQGEFPYQRPKQTVFIRLQGIVKFVVPFVQLHQQIDHGKIHGDDHGQKADGALLFLGAPIAPE